MVRREHGPGEFVLDRRNRNPLIGTGDLSNPDAVVVALAQDVRQQFSVSRNGHIRNFTPGRKTCHVHGTEYR